MNDPARNRGYRAIPSEVTVSFGPQEISNYISGIADVLQWINGFRAALPEDSSKALPTDWRELIELNIKLKQARELAGIPF